MTTETHVESERRADTPQAAVITSAPRLSREQLEAAMRVMDAHAAHLAARRNALPH